MTKKRKSRGRDKGGKGRSELVHCSNCGGLVPRDKAKKVTARMSLVEPSLAKDLRDKGAWVPTSYITKYYCISCSVHYGVVRVRAREERKLP